MKSCNLTLFTMFLELLSVNHVLKFAQQVTLFFKSAVGNGSLPMPVGVKLRA